MMYKEKEKKPLALDGVNARISERNRELLEFVRQYAMSEEGEIFCYAHADKAHLPHPVTHTPDMLSLAVAAGDLYLQHGDQEDLRFATNLIDRALDYYRSPAGSFHQQYAAGWTTPDVFRTAPWANCFFGHNILDCLELIEAHLDKQQKEKWIAALQALGEWIYGNPIVGTVVFNCSLDLCSVLWRIGKRLGRQDWIDWAQAKLGIRFDLHVSDEGLNMGEGGGCSGNYQLYATLLLSHHVYHVPEDQRSYEVLKKMHDANLKMATPDGRMPGNYGTRSSGFKEHFLVPPLVLAARGDGQARRLAEALWERDIDRPISSAPEKSVHNIGMVEQHLKTCIKHATNGPLEPKLRTLWEQALKVEPREPEVLNGVVPMPSIDYTIVRQGAWQAWATQYEKGNWTRGLNALWNAELGGFIFGTHHSLPGERGMERNRFELGDMKDWAAFPHVMVETDGEVYHSQRIVENIETSQQGESQGLTIEETLQSDSRKKLGRMVSEYIFSGDELTVKTQMKDLKGETSFDYHVYKHPLSFLAYWTGSAVDAIQEGQFPESGGFWGPENYNSPKEINEKIAMQIDNVLIFFELETYPEDMKIQLEKPELEGLHCGNKGGASVRLSTSVQDAAVSVKVKCVKNALR